MLVLALFLVAITLILLELFLPGGVFGVVGALLIIVSMALAFRQYHEIGFWIVVGELITATVIILVGIKHFPHSRAGKLLILGRRLDKKLGFSGTEQMEDYIGREGTSLTQLRPAGIAQFDSKRLDVVSEGTFIDKDRKVKVVAVEGNRIVVREQGTLTSGKEG
jgi:membrane-bound serine protease (ClpP class)